MYCQDSPSACSPRWPSAARVEVQNTTHLRTAMARSAEELSLAYFIRHEGYSREGFITPRLHCRFCDQYDEMDNSRTHLLFRGDEAVGTLRVCSYSPALGWTALPALEAFHREIGEHVGLDQAMVEPSRFAFRATDLPLRSKLLLFRHVVEAVDAIEARFVVAAVRHEHVGFYRSMRFEPKSDVHNCPKYPGVEFRVILMVLDVPRHRPELERHPRYGFCFCRSLAECEAV